MAVTREVKYRDEEYNVLIHLRKARVIEGMKRGQIIQERLSHETVKAVAEGEGALAPTLDTITHRLVSFYTYPACIAATVSIDNLQSYTGADGKKHPFTDGKELVVDIPFDEFLELPEALVLLWEEAANELNPHWLPQLKPPTKEAEAEAEVGKEPTKAETDPGPD